MTDYNYFQSFVFQTGEIDPDKAITLHLYHPSDDWDKDVIYQVDKDGYTLRFRATNKGAGEFWDDSPVCVEFEAHGITVAQFLLSPDEFRSLAYALEESV